MGKANPNKDANMGQITGTSALPHLGISPSAHIIKPIIPAKKKKVSNMVHVIIISFLSHL